MREIRFSNEEWDYVKAYLQAMYDSGATTYIYTNRYVLMDRDTFDALEQRAQRGDELAAAVKNVLRLAGE
jgi:hypothetical protein